MRNGRTEVTPNARGGLCLVESIRSLSLLRLRYLSFNSRAGKVPRETDDARSRGSLSWVPGTDRASPTATSACCASGSCRRPTVAPRSIRIGPAARRDHEDALPLPFHQHVSAAHMKSTRISTGTEGTSNWDEPENVAPRSPSARLRAEAPAVSAVLADLRPWRRQANTGGPNLPPRGSAPHMSNASPSASRRISGRTDSDVSADSFRSVATHLSTESSNTTGAPRLSHERIVTREISFASLTSSVNAMPENDAAGEPPNADAEGMPAPVPAARREQLLEDYLTATRRPLDLGRALAAIKLRCAAEVFCEKNEWARFAPRLPKTGAARRRFEELTAVPADELVADVQAHPQHYTRTLLTDLAQYHLLNALNIDIELYKQGIHKAGLYEGLHSVAGRVTTVTASGLTAGVSMIPGTDHALKAAQKAVRILAHELPANIVNPALTGRLRSITDVKEAFKRVGGQPVVAPQIERSPDMGAIVRSLRTQRRELTHATIQFREAALTEAGGGEAMGPMVDAFLALHDTADRQYRRRIGLNRTQTYSKGWGMAVNGVAAAGAVVTSTVPVVGQIAGPAILAATVPMQWGAGYLDERRNKHRYNLRANTKWGDFLTEGAARIHFRDLTTEHVSEAALRRSFTTQPEVQIAAVREVYEDALGEWVQQHAELERKVGAMESSGTTPVRALMPHRTQLAQLTEQIELAKQHAADFESFDPARWAAIPGDSLIGRCLDDLKQLEKANRRARLRKPGESAQIVQRYVQAFHAGVSTGTALPIVDALTATDSSYITDAQGHQTHHLRPPDEAGALTAGIGGGAVFTAATGEVRMTKADNKKLLSQTYVSHLQTRLHEARWVFQAGDKRVDLRTTAGYRKHVHSTWDELRLLGRAVGHGLVSGPVGLANLVRAKWWPRGELRLAKRQLRDSLDALEQAGLPRNPPPDGRRANTLSAMKDELYDYAAVRRHLGVDAAA